VRQLIDTVRTLSLVDELIVLLICFLVVSSPTLPIVRQHEDKTIEEDICDVSIVLVETDTNMVLVDERSQVGECVAQ